VYKQISLDTKLKTRKRIKEMEMTGKAHQGDEVPHWTVVPFNKNTYSMEQSPS